MTSRPRPSRAASTPCRAVGGTARRRRAGQTPSGQGGGERARRGRGVRSETRACHDQGLVVKRLFSGAYIVARIFLSVLRARTRKHPGLELCCDRRPFICVSSEALLKTRLRKYPGLVYNMRSSHRRPAHATHPPRAAARPRQTSHRTQALPPPPPAPPPSPPRLPSPATSRRIPPHLQRVHTAAGLPSHPSRSPRPRQLGAAAAAAGSSPSNSAHPSPAGASAAVRTPACGGSGDGGAMDHSPLPPPPPSQPPPVAVAAMTGAMAAAAAAGEAAVALPAPFPAPNGGRARPPSDSGGDKEWGGTAAGGAAVNAAVASARGRRRLGPCHIARDGRCGRRRGGASGAAVRAGDVEADGRHCGHGGDTRSRAREGGGGWPPRRDGGR